MIIDIIAYCIFGLLGLCILAIIPVAIMEIKQGRGPEFFESLCNKNIGGPKA
jgi:hypothetical protein